MNSLENWILIGLITLVAIGLTNAHKATADGTPTASVTPGIGGPDEVAAAAGADYLMHPFVVPAEAGTEAGIVPGMML